MKLWLLTNESYRHYDCNWGFVIRAPSDGAARLIASKQHGDEPHEMWLDAAKSGCTEVLAEGDPAVILTDFSAG